jgi:hypothetical protein
MRRLDRLFGAVLLAGCTNGLAQRQAEPATWAGKPETELVQSMGVPTRTYATSDRKVLTYEDRTVAGGVVRSFGLRGNACG